MNLYKRVALGVLLSFTLIMYGYILSEVGMNWGGLVLAVIFIPMSIMPYVFPELLMSYEHANEKYGHYIQSIRNVERHKKNNSEF